MSPRLLPRLLPRDVALSSSCGGRVGDRRHPVASEGDPASMEIVTLDGRLVEAARREGLTLVDTPSAHGG